MTFQKTKVGYKFVCDCGCNLRLIYTICPHCGVILDWSQYAEPRRKALDYLKVHEMDYNDHYDVTMGWN